MNVLRSIATLLLTACASAPAAASSAAQSAPITARTLNYYVNQCLKAAREARTSVGFVNLVPLNDAPTWPEAERILVSYKVSADRCSCILEAFRVFVAEYNAIMDREAPLYLAASQALADASEDSASEPGGRGLERLARQATGLRARLEASEFGFTMAAEECLGLRPTGNAPAELNQDWAKAVEAL